MTTHGCRLRPILNQPMPLAPGAKISPFKVGEKFIYKVEFNGIYVGKIAWKYLGQLQMGSQLAEVVSLSSDVKILKLFSLESKEKLYIDSGTHLPLRVEREVKFFGRQEKIQEEYNQKQDYVKLIKQDAKGKKEKTIHLKAPIHNIVALLYFFPKDIKLSLGESFFFNLPTQMTNMKVTALEMLSSSLGSYEVYVLKGQPQKFKVWLEKDKRIPLRIEFKVFLGRIIISRIA